MRNKFVFLMICLLLAVPFLSVQAQEPQNAIAIDWIFIRAEPTTHGDLVAEYPAGTELLVLQKDFVNYRDAKWSQVQVVGTNVIGWVWSPKIMLLPMLTTVSANRLNIREQPSTEAVILGELTRGAVVEIIGREDILANEGIWIYVREQSTGLTGWILSDYVDYYWRRWRAPILLHDGRTLDTPVMPGGFVTAHVPRYFGAVYREVHTTPDYQAPTIGTLSQDSLVAIYGKNGNWLYVQGLGVNSGLTGWIGTLALNFPIDYVRGTIPVIDPVANPTLPAEVIQPVNSLPGIVNRSYGVTLMSEPSDQAVYSGGIDANVTVTVLGRNANSRYLYVQYEDQIGWVSYWSLDVQGDVDRLPIYSMKGSPGPNTGD